MNDTILDEIDRHIRNLSDAEKRVREQAARALRYSSPKAIPALMVALSDGDPDVRLEAVLALGSLNAIQAIDALTDRLRNDPHEEVRIYAADALAEIRVESDLAPRADWPFRDPALERKDPGVATLLIAAFQNEKETARVRANILYALGNTRSKVALPALCAALGNADPELREQAARGLGSLIDSGDPAYTMAVEPLCAALKDANPCVIVEASAVLGCLEDPKAIPCLINALHQTEGDNANVRAALIKAIGSIDAPGNASLMTKYLQSDPDCYVKRAAAESLKFSEFDTIPQEVLEVFADSDADPFIKSALAKSLVACCDHRVLPYLSKALEDLNWIVRSDVSASLCHLPDRRSIKPLIALLQDSDETVRGNAALALAAIANHTALKPTQYFLKQLAVNKAIRPMESLLAREESPSVRRRLVWALSFFNLKRIMRTLSNSLLDEDPYVRATAVNALAEILEESSLRELVEGLPDLPADVKENMEEIIEELNHDVEDGWTRSVQLGTVHYE